MERPAPRMPVATLSTNRCSITMAPPKVMASGGRYSATQVFATDERAVSKLMVGELEVLLPRKQLREALFIFHSNPCSEKLIAWFAATMKWSSTLTSTSASASLRLRVSTSSA
jgi:hypothetical protein